MDLFVRKRTPEEATQWIPGKKVAGVYDEHSGGAFLTTKYGRVFIKPGDYILTSHDGERRAVPGVEFEKDYEAAPPESDELTEEWMNGLRILAESVHDTAVKKGWWDAKRETGTILMLAVSELAEAMEEDRHGFPLNAIRHVSADKKPEGFGIEIADAIIRLLDTCQGLNIDIAQAIRIKHCYNKSRGFKHGGKAY